MTRKPSLRLPGAIYPIISRGNSRKPIFELGARSAFPKILFQACAKYCWLLHASVIMNTHYHRALETFEPTVVDGL